MRRSRSQDVLFRSLDDPPPYLTYMAKRKSASMENFTGAQCFSEIASALLGRKIVDVRYLSDDEMEARSDEHARWQARPPVLVLDDGTLVVAVRDNEKNDGGTLELCRPDGVADLPISLH